MSDPTKRLATAAQTAFVSPTALASQRLGSRLSPRPLSPASSSEAASVSSSRRSPSLRTGPDQAHLFDQMGAANQVVLKKSKVQSNSRVASPVNSMGSKSTLDLRNNDNSFHVLASLLVEFFHSKLMGDCLHLRFEDREHVERLLPETARASFCQAVGHRLERTPSVPTTSVQFLTLQCQELGLDRLEAASNPILAVMGLSTPGQQATVPYLSLLDTSSFHSAGSFKKSETTKQPPTSVSYTAPPPVPQQPVQQQPAQPAPPPRTGARSISPLDTPSLGAMTATTEDDLARQQLLAELREASNFMAASVNPETTQFWKTQVLQLQARLRTLHGASSPPASPLQVLESNRRLVTQHQQQQQQQQTREQQQQQQNQQQYVPPPASVTVPTDRVVASPQSQHAAAPQQPSLDEEQDMYHQHQQQQDDDQSYSAPSMVDVVAPADLPGGYHFEAEIEGQRFLATVPSGGCKEGETFSCAWRELDSVATDVPVGYWKDGPFDVWSLGVCHPVIWNALVAPLFVLGQIQTRIKLDFLGRPQLGPSKTNISNRTMMASVMAFWFLMNALMFGAYNLKWYRRMELSVADLAAFALVNFTMYGFVVFVAQSTRSTLRERFLIRETRCYDLEDLCCATWCLPCTVSQMARHTAHYEAYEAVCCSKTGLPDGVSMQQAPAQAPQYVV